MNNYLAVGVIKCVGIINLGLFYKTDMGSDFIPPQIK